MAWTAKAGLQDSHEWRCTRKKIEKNGSYEGPEQRGDNLVPLKVVASSVAKRRKRGSVVGLQDYRDVLELRKKVLNCEQSGPDLKCVDFPVRVRLGPAVSDGVNSA